MLLFKYLRQGFTLVELAVVLVVLGLLIGLGASLIGPLTKRAKYSESREEVSRAVEALMGYAIRTGNLTLPGGITPRDPEDYDPSVPDPICGPLGIRGLDSWNRALLFRVANEMLGGDLCTLSGTSFTIVENGQSKQNIAFMVVSGGPNFNIQTDSTVYAMGTAGVDDFDYDGNRPEEYDDIVEYVSLFELQAKRCNYSLSVYCGNVTVSLDNNVKSFKKNGGSCENEDTVYLTASDYIESFSDPNCNNICGNFTFSGLLAYDSDKDCQVQINRHGNSCYVLDL